MTAKRIIQVVLGVVALVPLLFIAAGIANELKLHKMRNGIVLEGRVLEGGELGKPKGIRTHYLKVKFENKTGEPEVRTFAVDRDDFVHANQVGSIPITYVPENPALSRVGKMAGYDRTPLWVAIGGFVLIVAAFAVIQFLPKSRIQESASFNELRTK